MVSGLEKGAVIGISAAGRRSWGKAGDPRRSLVVGRSVEAERRLRRGGLDDVRLCGCRTPFQMQG